jgi:hypothetical protein
MKDIVRALEALQEQVQFEVLEAGAAVAAAAETVRRAESVVEAAVGRCSVVDDESRRAMKASRVNPALVTSLRRLSRVERGELSAAKSALGLDRAREEQARAALADLRNRERSFERALQSALAEERRRLEAREAVRADESWLQRRMRAIS